MSNDEQVMSIKQYAHKKVKSLLEIGAHCHKTRSWGYAPIDSPCISVFEIEENQLVEDLRKIKTALLAPHLAKIKRLEEALRLAELWLCNCVPITDLPGPKPLPVIRAALSETTPDNIPTLEIQITDGETHD